MKNEKSNSNRLLGSDGLFYFFAEYRNSALNKHLYRIRWKLCCGQNSKLLYFHSTKECKLAIGMEVIADSDVVSISPNIIAGLARLDNQQKSSELGGRLSITVHKYKMSELKFVTWNMRAMQWKIQMAKRYQEKSIFFDWHWLIFNLKILQITFFSIIRRIYVKDLWLEIWAMQWKIHPEFL